ncbi:MAG: disulfide bond formation protein B [Rhodospirillaceae bacterium]|jgi:disulfide bond formation protein DsbB|nr:disulfide bond formation protein B [Rhodospirillaceae bacterium]
MQQLFATKTALFLVPLAAVTALALAFIGQYGFELQPCVLCIYQRWPFAIVTVLCLAALTPWLRPAAYWILGLAALVLAINAGIAVYHVGVEQYWWIGSEACVGKTGTAQTLAELRAQIMATPITRCDEVAFSLFGVSMAGYNVLFSAGLAFYAGLAAGIGFRNLHKQ